MIDQKTFEASVDNVLKLVDALTLTASRLRAMECFVLELVESMNQEPSTRQLDNDD